MGEAKRRAAEQRDLIWHHTSILRTNLIWMSGVIELEGRSAGAMHPAFGEVFTDASFRRPMRDFPPVAWFTSQIEVPKCLQTYALMTKDAASGELRREELSSGEAGALSMNRIALGFLPARIGAVRWPDYYGYASAEGRDLNETARDLGDDPDLWWITEQATDVLEATSIRGSSSITGLKMDRMDDYLPNVRQMVRLCRAIPGTVIPPTWIGSAAHRSLIKAGRVHRDCRQYDALVQ